LDRRGKRRINIIQILMHSGMVNSAASAAAQRELADVLLKPPLGNVDLLNWHAFDRAIQAGYDYARATLGALPGIPRLPAAADPTSRNSLAAELERRLATLVLGDERLAP
jgi:predicted acylesterase/phospholipase RssA